MKAFILTLAALSLATIGISGDGTLPFGMAGSLDHSQVELEYSFGSNRASATLGCTDSHAVFNKKGGEVSINGVDSFTIAGYCEGSSSKREILAVDPSTNNVVKLNGVLSISHGEKKLTGTLLRSKLGSSSQSSGGTFTLIED